MSTAFQPLPVNALIGEYQIVSVINLGSNYMDYSAIATTSGANVVLREYTSAGLSTRNSESGQIVPNSGAEEQFEECRSIFLSSANPAGLLGSVMAQGNTYLVYEVQAPARTIRTAAPSPLRPPIPPRRKSGIGGMLIGILVVMALLGGVGYLYLEHQKEQDERIRVAAEQGALDRKNEELRAAARLKAEQEEEQAERERLAAEEAARKKKEEEDRLKNEANTAKGEEIVVVDKETPDEPEDTGVARDDDPRLKIYNEPLVLLGTSATSTKNQELWQKAIDTAFDTNRFDRYKDFIEKSLKENASKMISFGKFEIKAFNQSPKFKTAMKDYALLMKIDPMIIMEARTDDMGESFYRYLLNDTDESLTLLLRSLSGQESKTEMKRILGTWLSYWKTDSGEAQKKYLSLSLACALTNPSTLGSARTRYGQAATMDEVFKFFREKSEKSMLKTDITKMEPWNLVYVVNVRMPLSEMEWAVQKMKQKGLSRKQWSQAYPMIKYRMDQAANRRDIYDDYTLEEILKKGGTCMDQGYFASNTAKSNGIPAAYVTGDGKLGGHAWFIYMSDNLKWESAGGIGYTSGKTGNPQTGQQVHESLLLTANDKRNSGNRLDQTRDLVDVYRMMMLLKREDAVMDLLTKAQLSTPEHPLPWETTIEYYKREGNTTTLEQWELLVDNLRRKFKNRPDYLEMAKEIEDEYIFPNKNALDTANTLARQRRKLERDTSEGRADLSADAVKRQAELLVKQEKYNELNTLYKKAMRDYGSRSDAFKDIIRQYYDFASQASDKDKRLPGVVKEIDRNFQKYVNTGSSDLFITKQEVGIQNTIAGYYRAIGDEKKADSLIKQGETRINRANRAIRPQN